MAQRYINDPFWLFAIVASMCNRYSGLKRCAGRQTGRPEDGRILRVVFWPCVLGGAGWHVHNFQAMLQWCARLACPASKTPPPPDGVLHLPGTHQRRGGFRWTTLT